MSELINIQDSISAGRTGEALALLQDEIRNRYPEWQASLLLLQAAWAQLEQEIMEGLISSEEAERRRNRINASGLQLVQALENGTQHPENVIRALEKEFLTKKVAERMKTQKQDHTTISGSTIRVDRGAEAVIGSGNTVSRKIFHALGRRQFWALTLGLILVASLAVFGGRHLIGQQEQAYVSLSAIQAELVKLTELQPAIARELDKPGSELDDWLQLGMESMKKKDYAAAVRYLEKVAQEAPLATVYQNLAFAYEQLGETEQAEASETQARNIAGGVYPDPPVSAVEPPASSSAPVPVKELRINLADPEKGGKMAAASNQRMKDLIDGELRNRAINLNGPDWAIFGFQDGKTATIDQFDFYIKGTNQPRNYHVSKFELLVSTEAVSGPYTSIGIFEPFDGYLEETPFQEFKFPPVRAKYLKFQILDEKNIVGIDVQELRIWGKLE